ncbi:MAG: hypothetical protein GEU75_11855 [Dehalococcoidia bacterium]|nr:hypothetical protein [Dehalococcoidia bacterium]
MDRERGGRLEESLTRREMEVLHLVRQGLTNEEIAQQLNISFSTAKYHVGEIISKTGVVSRYEAARLLEDLEESNRPRHHAIGVLVWFHHLRSRASGKSVTLSMGLGVAAATLVAIAVLVFGPFSGPQSANVDFTGSDAAIGLDVAPFDADAITRTRLASSLPHTILLTETDPSNLGSQADAISTLARVASLVELKAALRPDVALIVVDASAATQVADGSFLREQWSAGRGIIGLNLCLADLERSGQAPTAVAAPAWELLPLGEAHFYASNNGPPQGFSLCAAVEKWTQAGLPYFTFLPRRPSIRELDAERANGQSQLGGGGAAGLDLVDGDACMTLRNELAQLDAGE